MKITKNRKETLTQFDKTQVLKIDEAIKTAKKISKEKFNSSLRVSFNLNVDPRHADQQIRGMISLPNGTGKTKKVLAIVDDSQIVLAKKANADHVGNDSLLQKIEKENWFDFDVIVTTPEMMPKFAKYGKLLGPKGLMPNPKLGTVTNDIEKIIFELKKGKIEYRVDKDGNINLLFGLKSFSDDKLIENYHAIYSELKRVKPIVVKGAYFKNIAISTTMGIGIKVQIEI